MVPPFAMSAASHWQARRRLRRLRQCPLLRQHRLRQLVAWYARHVEPSMLQVKLFALTAALAYWVRPMLRQQFQTRPSPLLLMLLQRQRQHLLLSQFRQH